MKKILHLGLTPPQDATDAIITHCPLIRIIPRSPADDCIKAVYQNLSRYTHAIFTSKNTVKIFFDFLHYYKKTTIDLIDKKIITVGKETSKEVIKHGSTVQITANRETAEGVVEEIKKIQTPNMYVLWPRSALSRPVINEALDTLGISYYDAIFYDTKPRYPEYKPDISKFDEIVFTSPSTVDAFLEIFGPLPDGITFSTIGPVTQQYLRQISLGK